MIISAGQGAPGYSQRKAVVVDLAAHLQGAVSHDIAVAEFIKS
jgi:hypothetical protein